MNETLIEVGVYIAVGNAIEHFVTNIGNISVINEFICDLNEGYGIKFDEEAVNDAVKNISRLADIGARTMPFAITDYSGYYILIMNEIKFVH